jgi:replicative DNA helicase
MLDEVFYNRWILNENALLASMVHDESGSVIDDAIQNGITEDFFYEPKAQLVYRAILEISKAGEAVDLVTLMEPLRKELLDSRIFMADITEIMNTVETHAHAFKYLKVVKECWRLSWLHKAAKKVQWAIEEGKDSDEALSELTSSITALDKGEASLITASEFVKMGYDYLTSKEEEAQGLSTGFTSLDRVLRHCRQTIPRKELYRSQYR